ncbi:hypothetical protein FOL47_000847, partial [Perkinsus chesapeaki]
MPGISPEISYRPRAPRGDIGPPPEELGLSEPNNCQSPEDDEMIKKWTDATRWSISMTENAVARHDESNRVTKKSSHSSWIPHMHKKDDMDIKETKDAMAMQVDNSDPECKMSVDCEFHKGLLKGQIVIEGMDVPYLFQVAASWEMDMAPLWFPMLETVDKVAEFTEHDKAPCGGGGGSQTPTSQMDDLEWMSDSPCSCPTSSSTRASYSGEEDTTYSHPSPSSPVILDEMMTRLYAVPPVPGIKGVDSYSHRTLYAWSPKCSPTPGSLMVDYSPPLDAKSWKGVKLEEPGRRVFRTEQKATAVYVRPSLTNPNERSDVFVTVLADPGVPTWLVPNSVVKWILRIGARGFVDKVMSVMNGCTTDPTHRYAVRIAERYEDLYWKYAFSGFYPPEAVVPKEVCRQILASRRLERSKQLHADPERAADKDSVVARADIKAEKGPPVVEGKPPVYPVKYVTKP